MPADYERNIEDFVAILLENADSSEEIVFGVEQYLAHSGQETEKEMRQLRMELEFEKSKYQRARNVFLSQITDRSELETFFFECLGEMRKEILHRGPRGLVAEPDDENENENGNESEAVSKSKYKSKPKSEGEVKHDLKPEKLTAGQLDPHKFQALQAVLSNDRILITLFDEIFGPPSKREEYPMLFQKPSRGARDASKKVATLISPGTYTNL